MAQIGVQRLSARDTQHHRTKNDETDAGVVPDKQRGMVWAQRPQDFGVPNDVRHTQGCNTKEPRQRDRAEKLANAPCAALLHHEQAKQHHQGDRDHVLREVGGYHLQALHRRQHRDGWGNNTVAIKKRGAKDADAQQPTAQAGFVFDRL